MHLSVGIILILSVLLPNMVNKARDELRVRKRRAEVSKAAS